jgi:bacteriocin biosynthesis cyclodehydratase domain-containing protein
MEHDDTLGNPTPTSGPPEPDADRPYVALPLQLIDARGDDVIVRRGSAQLLIRGVGARAALTVVLEAMTGEGATVEEVSNRFAAPDRPAVLELIEQLATRQFVAQRGSRALPQGPETALDVFYWHFGTSAPDVNGILNRTQLAVLGVNRISRQLVEALTDAGLHNIDVVDHAGLRNLSMFDGDGPDRASAWRAPIQPTAYEEWTTGSRAKTFDCLVATSDFGGLRLMQEWNSLCVELNRQFLPVVLQDMVGYVGPLVIPGETACFDCFLARMDSNHTGDAQGHVTEWAAFGGQHVAAFHPSMASVLGDFAAIELTKFYSRSLPAWKVGTVLEVNLLAGALDARRVLRVPRCRTCSHLIKRSSTSTVKTALAAAVVEP